VVLGERGIVAGAASTSKWKIDINDFDVHKYILPKQFGSNCSPQGGGHSQAGAVELGVSLSKKPSPELLWNSNPESNMQ
jgi:hypothetical protein